MTWWRRRTLRVRLLLIGVVGLSLGLLAGGLALVAALGVVLQRSVDAEVTRTASDVAELVDRNRLPQPVPVAGADLVQVVDDHGRVLSSSLDADRLVPMLHPDELASARTGRPLFVDGDRLGLSGPIRVVAMPAGPPGDPQTVLVGRSMADVLKGMHLLRSVLLVLFPLLVLILALVFWRAINAALRPVESLRRGAEEITGASRSGRLPVPVGSDEIHLLAVTLNGMLDRLEAARNRQREFVADAAHELRSPLTNMRTQLEVAQHLGSSADPELVNDLLTDTKRLARLVDDLLLLARTDDSAEIARPVPVDLTALLQDAAARYPVVAVSLPEDPLWTSGDPDALLRIITNLLDNAVRHAASSVSLSASSVSSPTSSVSSTSSSGGGRILVTVTDDGPGIPAGDRERVFERFTRLDDARARDDGGSGLGLAIVRELVRRHGGRVRLLDAPSGGPGLLVEVDLPAAVL
jgi:signal transduction histidine kinase